MRWVDGFIVEGAAAAGSPTFVQAQSNWLETDPIEPSYIQNKPDVLTLAEVQVLINDQSQADWNQIDPLSASYIQNKPTIPAAQVQSDWAESNSGAMSFILNKPSLAFLPLAGGTLTGDLTAPNITVTGRTTVKGVRETQAVLDTILTPDNGTTQTRTLTANLTITEGAWADGEAVVVTYTGLNTYTLTHPVSWKKSESFPATLQPVQEIIYRRVNGVVRYSPGAGWLT